MQSTQTRQYGFTLVEVVVIAPIVILFIGAFVGLIVALTGNTLSLRYKNVSMHDTQYALTDMQATASKATGYLTTTGELPAPMGKNDDTTAFTNITTSYVGEPETLIIMSPTTTKSPFESDTEPIYQSSPACDHNFPIQTYMTIYFVKNKSLYKRTYVPVGTACAVPWQKNSCSDKKHLETHGNATATCKTRDEKLLDDVVNLDIQYFQEGVTDTPLDDSLAGIAKTISIHIVTSRDVASSSVVNDIQQHATSIAPTHANFAQIGSNPLTQQGIPTPPLATQISATQSPDNPYWTDFVWPAVGNAASYTIKYQPHAGATAISEDISVSGSPQYKFTAKKSARKQTANLQVIVNTTSGGSYHYGTGSRTNPQWVDCAPKNGWNNYSTLTGDGNFNNLGYTITSSGAVGLKGLVRTTSAANFGEGKTICTLPEGLRPEKRLIFNAETEVVNGIQGARVDVDTSGNIQMIYGDGGYVSLDGIIYMTPAGSPTWTTPVSLGGGWLQWNATPYPNVGYWKDSQGRVWVQGLAKPGASASQDITSSSSLRSIKDLHIAISNNNRVGTVNTITETSRNALHSRQVAGGTFASLQLLYYSPTTPSGATITLNTIGLKNGWANYNTALGITQWAMASCKKGADDIVILQGLLAYGNPNSIANVASTCGTMSTGKVGLFSIANSSENQGRIDLQPNGELLPRKYATGWTSLDTIHYIAD